MINLPVKWFFDRSGESLKELQLRKMWDSEAANKRYKQALAEWISLRAELELIQYMIDKGPEIVCFASEPARDTSKPEVTLNLDNRKTQTNEPAINKPNTNAPTATSLAKKKKYEFWKTEPRSERRRTVSPKP